jgi:2-polyprenyl-3-methyl-5-hydroxy-6-metoxy-1,4-benzoquinol methylase
MTTHLTPPGYETKSGDYFLETRPEMLPFVPLECRRILDVGCGSGGFGQTLKRDRTVEVWGIEPVSTAAATAATRLDRVIESIFSPQLPLQLGSFDCVIFNDVLEHLFDPREALIYARQLLTPRGCIVASIPNIRHFPTLWALVVRKEWTYREFGILDRTHLRFFTRKSIEPLFRESGLLLEQVKGIKSMCSPFPEDNISWRYFRILNALTLGGVDDMRYLQFAIVARASSPASNHPG